MMQEPLFTTIVHAYNRPALLKQSVEALQRQTYSNLEIILINNGGIPEVVEYLHEIALADSRIKLIHFSENQFSWDDPVKFIPVCWNAALAEATGEYVWIQQDDDMLADDYIEKMAALFQGNPECTTAAGLAVGFDLDGNILDTEPRTKNFRPRYMAGHELVLGMVRGDRSLFGAPGTIFAIRRDVLVEAGGYQRSIEQSQLYGIVPFGITGFDETAILYWRRHEGQINLMLSARGWVGIKEVWSCLKECEIEHRWQIFGADVAKEVVSHFTEIECRRAAQWFIRNLAARKFSGAWRILALIWYRPQFWPIVLRRAPRELIIGVAWRLLKLMIRRGFKVFSAFGKIMPGPFKGSS